MSMRALSLHQPWASLILQYKRHETRSWQTKYRGDLLIHAALRKPDISVLGMFGLASADIPLGAAVCVATLTDCYPTDDIRHLQSDEELKAGDWSPGRYAWRLDNIRPLDQPITCPGRQKLWTPDEALTQKIAAQVSLGAPPEQLSLI